VARLAVLGNQLLTLLADHGHILTVAKLLALPGKPSTPIESTTTIHVKPVASTPRKS
jgi:hypothetical protein